MPFTESATDILQVAASTMRHFKKTLVDQVFADQVILSVLGVKNLNTALRKVRTPEGGVYSEGLSLEESPGRQIQFPIQYLENTTTDWYDGHDVLDITPQDPYTAAVYDWRHLAGSINLPNSILDLNDGSDTQIFKLLEAQKNTLKMSLADTLGDALLGARAASSKEPFGLCDLVADDPTANPAGGNVGGISRVTDTYWRNYTADFGGGAFGTAQTGDGMKAVRKLIRRTTFGSEKPHFLLAGESGYESIENCMVAQIQYDKPAALALAQAGFDAFTVKGIPVTMERKIETVRTAESLSGDAVYALNLNFLKLFGVAKRWFEPSKMKEPTDQDAIVMHIITRLAFATNGPRYQGVLFNIAAV